MSSAKIICAAVLSLFIGGQAFGYGYYYGGYYYSGYPVYAVPPPVVYAPPPIVYTAPPPVVYAPPRVVYAPPPVVYEAPPVVVEAPVVRVKWGKVEFDSLDAKARLCPEGLRVTVRYEIELKRLPPGHHELMVQFSERGRVIADEEGHAFAAVAALDHPTDADDEEFEFHGRLTTVLPHGTFLNWKRLRVDARVIEKESGGVAARKTSEVDD